MRDRKVTSRTFEDVISSLFHGKTLDEESKPNPEIPSYIKSLDSLSDTFNTPVFAKSFVFTNPPTLITL